MVSFNKQFYKDKAFKYADDEVLEYVEEKIKYKKSQLKDRSVYEKKTGKTSALVFLSLLYNIPLIVKNEEEKDYLKREYPILEVCSINDYNNFKEKPTELILDEVFEGNNMLDEMNKNNETEFYGLFILN